MKSVALREGIVERRETELEEDGTTVRYRTFS